eukprot:TRINITY_DN2968_c0_g1_i1.p1 TRINITY_DN2968_c0_g1~~TRINITY_DN2968_c0_g1_i1.p1  ORF type:complete len:191 (+),score=32.20 TRINITY_DN2968_c0_g1_i1:912-1484(+)
MIGIGLMQHDLRSSSSKAVLVRTVFSGRGVFYAHGAEVFVVWAASTDEVFGCYCSCGGDELNENVGARVRTGVSSSCTHAVAYSLALRVVAIHVMCASVPSLLHQHSVLNGSGVKDTDVDAFPVFQGADGRATHVVAYNKILCIVQTPPTGDGGATAAKGAQGEGGRLHGGGRHTTGARTARWGGIAPPR